jgi:hypothetical protein
LDTLSIVPCAVALALLTVRATVPLPKEDVGVSARAEAPAEAGFIVSGWFMSVSSIENAATVN